MEQPLRSRSTVSLAISDGTSALGAVAAREQYVLLRVPDCTPRLVTKDMAEAEGATPPRGVVDSLRAVLRRLIDHWRRPRTLLTGALALALIVVVVALAAGNRNKGARHADGVRHDGSRTKQAGVAPVMTCESRSEANAVGALDDAPFFHADANGGRANQPGSVDSGSSVVTHPSTGPNPQVRKDAAPKARLEQRIDRVPSQY